MHVKAVMTAAEIEMTVTMAGKFMMTVSSGMMRSILTLIVTTDYSRPAPCGWIFRVLMETTRLVGLTKSTNFSITIKCPCVSASVWLASTWKGKRSFGSKILTNSANFLLGTPLFSPSYSFWFGVR
jgi:hypothetical protein